MLLFNQMKKVYLAGRQGFAPIIILLSLVVVALMGFAYLAGSRGILSNKVPLVSYSSPSPSPTPDPTSGWAEYLRFVDYYTFKYPASFGGQGIVSGPISGNPVFMRTFSDPSTIMEGTDAPFDGFSLYSIVSTGDQSFSDYIKQEVKSFEASPRGKPVGGIVQKTINVGGQSVVSLKVEDNITLFYVPIPNSKRLAVFSRINKNASFIDIFDQILSTIKFTK